MADWKVTADDDGVHFDGVEHDPDEWPAYENAGIERIVLSMESEQADAVLPQLDAWAKRL